MPLLLLIPLRIVVTPVAAAVITVSFVALTLAVVARGTLLEPAFYAEALEANSVYDRVYSEVLRSTALAEDSANLAGGVQTTGDAELETLLRDVLPPEYVQSQVEANIASGLAYLKGDRADLSLVITLDPVLDDIGPAAIAFVSERLGRVTTREVGSAEAFQAELSEAARRLADGEIPEVLPSLKLSGDELRAATAMLLGAYEGPERSLVEAALAEGDTIGALRAALAVMMQPGIDRRVAALRAELGPGATLDLVEQAASDTGETREEWLAGTESPRRVISALSSWLLPGSILALAVSTTVLGLLYLPGLRRALAVSGSGLALAGALGVAAWYIQSETLPGAARAAVLHSNDDTSQAWTIVVADVAEWMARESSGLTWPPAVTALAAGIGLIATGIMAGRRGERRPPTLMAEPVAFAERDDADDPGEPPRLKAS